MYYNIGTKYNENTPKFNRKKNVDLDSDKENFDFNQMFSHKIQRQTIETTKKVSYPIDESKQKEQNKQKSPFNIKKIFSYPFYSEFNEEMVKINSQMPKEEKDIIIATEKSLHTHKREQYLKEQIQKISENDLYQLHLELIGKESLSLLTKQQKEQIDQLTKYKNEMDKKIEIQNEIINNLKIDNENIKKDFLEQNKVAFFKNQKVNSGIQNQYIFNKKQNDNHQSLYQSPQQSPNNKEIMNSLNYEQIEKNTQKCLKNQILFKAQSKKIQKQNEKRLKKLEDQEKNKTLELQDIQEQQENQKIQISKMHLMIEDLSDIFNGPQFNRDFLPQQDNDQIKNKFSEILGFIDGLKQNKDVLEKQFQTPQKQNLQNQSPNNSLINDIKYESLQNSCEIEYYQGNTQSEKQDKKKIKQNQQINYNNKNYFELQKVIEID
ncbi:hypothetical protein PPERSA_04719 [Pseudocohnilembus persalinus]|uniref:Uncharacterized protein n=1 Tax=Pseudocohnilembus persalinus TaxID=266149 RepID=A0A0V0R594_PSEPJ|nr:hypothetical protein PPERSA_04719 [Pseudocohnilembus persalinus]|eukprot:KRX09413.1 hypothetical protein PPERSA_04719 [Pseudocohnilembus persalinus]